MKPKEAGKLMREALKKLTYLDKERLDFLQKLNDRKKYTGKIILRESNTGRGWRLHETSRGGGFSSVREAIDDVINQKI